MGIVKRQAQKSVSYAYFGKISVILILLIVSLDIEFIAHTHRTMLNLMPISLAEHGMLLYIPKPIEDPLQHWSGTFYVKIAILSLYF